MKIIDRYVFGCFFRNLVLWYIVIIGFYVIIDLFGKIDKFFGYPTDQNHLVILAKYYFFHSYPFFDIVTSGLILLSGMSVMLLMVHRNEVIALMSMGVSQMRIIFPILLATILFTLILSYARECIMPAYITEFVRTPDEYAKIDSCVSFKTDLSYDDATGIRINGDHVFPDKKLIENPKFIVPQTFNISGNEVDARRAIFCPANADHPAGFLLEEVSHPQELLTRPSIQRNLAPSSDTKALLPSAKKNENSAPPEAEKTVSDNTATDNATLEKTALAQSENASAAVPEASKEQQPIVSDSDSNSDLQAGSIDVQNDEPVLFSPHDTPWLQQDQCFIVSGLNCDVLAVGAEWKTYASTVELIQAANNPSFRMNHRDLQTRIHNRILRPIADLLPLFLGLPIIFFRMDRNIFESIFLGMAIAGLYIGVQYGCLFLGARSSSPILFAWIPMILFIPIVILTFTKLLDFS